MCYTLAMNSRDILFLSLSVAALVATGFWVWLLWYIIRTFKSVGNLVEDFRDRLTAIDEILHAIREKLTTTHVQLSFLVDGLRQLMTFINNRRDSKKRRSSSRASSSADDF